MVKPPSRKATTAALLAAGLTVVAIATSVKANTLAPLAAPAPTVIATATAVPLVDMRCGSPGTNAFGFTPPLTLTTQPTVIERTTAYRNCSAPAFPAIRSGYEHKQNTVMDDCIVMLTSTAQANYNVIWNTSQTSTLTVTRSANLSGNTLTVTFTGTVTAGLFLGKNVRQVFTGNATEVNQCLAGTGQVPFIISDVSLVIS